MLYLYLSLLGLAGVAGAAFGVADAKAAFDGDPSTPTLSSFIRAWRRERPWHFAALAVGILALLALPVWLILHLLADVA